MGETGIIIGLDEVSLSASTQASYLNSNLDIHTGAQLLGHRDLRMATRYRHRSSEFLSTAIGRLDAIFGEAKCLPAKAA
jgi:hypothetical protein